jgi:hypothetical protein
MMKCFVQIRTVALAGALIACSATFAQAQATRTWVSGVGDDANPCSRTAPCKTFAGAISKTAAGGIIDALDDAGFGAITITKSITIDGGGHTAGLLASGGINAVNVNGAGIVVFLRHLNMEGQGTTIGLNGINVINASEVHVEHCTISTFSNNAIKFASSGVAALFVNDLTITKNTAGGIVVSTGRAMIENLHAESNGNAVAAVGVVLVTVRNSYAAGNSNGFAAVVNAGAVVNVEDSTIANNSTGLVVNSGATIRVSNSLVTGNGTGMSNDGVSFLVSLSGNQVVGNTAAGNAFTSTVTKQ